VMERVRRVFNPKNLCNPGKVIPTRASCAEVGKWPHMVARVLFPEGPKGPDAGEEAEEQDR